MRLDAQLAVPLIVGVIGHRDLRPSDTAALEGYVGSIFDDFEKRIPHTNIVLLSALAAGADTLVARVALQRGIQVIACLPYALDLHLEKFDERGRNDQRAMLAKCAEVRIAPYNHVTEDEAYVRNGYYISDNSNALIAIWDGLYNGKPGGTGSIVRYRLEGPRAEDKSFARLYTPEAASVYKIVCPRLGQPEFSPMMGVERLLPQISHLDPDEVKEIDDDTLDSLERFNTDLINLNPPADNSGDFLLSLQGAADRLANAYQHKTLRMMNWLFILGFVAASAQTICVHYPQIMTPLDKLTANLILITKVVSLIAAGVVYLLTRNTDYQSHYQDYRALSEGLRVQVAWRNAGLFDNVERYYLRMHQGDLQWIRSVLRTVVFIEDQANAAAVTHERASAWVDEQAKYYGDRGQLEQEKQHKYESLAKVLATISGVFSGFVGVSLIAIRIPLIQRAPLLTVFLSQHPFIQSMLRDAFPILLGIVPLSSILLLRYAERRGFKMAASRYARMHRFFDMGRSRLTSVGSAQPVSREIIYELGKVSLAEHTDWLVAGRERPISARSG